MASKKVKWNSGAIFLIPLLDETYAVGQVLDLQMPNIVRCALFDERIFDIDKIEINQLCLISDLISLLACSREQLDYNVWKIIGYKEIKINKRNFPNEHFRTSNWIGAKHYDAAIIEDFMNAYYCLAPWDDWFNPNYLDHLLISLEKKPSYLVYKKSNK
jgi:hypothetical protein